MKILITGAAGDIGSRLVSIFSVDESVTLFTTAARALPVNTKSEHLESDIRDPKLVEWIMHIQPDVIIHLASIVKLPKNMSLQEAYDVDVFATKTLLDTAVSCGVKKIIVTSSGAAYGYWRDNPEWLTEDMPVRGNDDYFYSSHKKQVELLLKKYRDEYPQLKQVVLRPSTVLGPNFKNPITNMFTKNIISGIARCDSPFVIIWVDDLVNYLIESAKTDIEGVYNVAGDGTITLKEIAKYLNKPYLPIPAWLIKSTLFILKPLRISQYGPEQVKFIQYRPVLSNYKIKSYFKYQPEKTTREAFFSFLEQSEKLYIKQ